MLKSNWVFLSVLLAVGSSIAIVIGSGIAPYPTKAKSLPVRIDRWLEVRQLAGQVTYKQGQTTQPAKIGNRLKAIGDAISTGAKSTAVLVVDTEVGFVNISENTSIRVQELRMARDGGRITRLEVTSGQASLQVRPFTNSTSRLEVKTPAGLSGVRGTKFGVSVQPDGKTGVATLEGSVVTSGRGRSVPVNAGFQSLVVPGEPPSPPVRLTDKTSLDVQQLTAENEQTARISGKVDPVNLLVVTDAPQNINSDGQFDIRVPLPANRRIQAVVITPLGKKQVYELAVP